MGGENEFGVTGKVKVNILLVAENQKKRCDKLGAWNNVRTDWGKRNGKRHVDINGFHSGEDKNHTQTSPFSVILMDIRWGWFHFYILMSSHLPGCASVAVSLSTYTRDSNRDDVIGGRHATVNKEREREGRILNIVWKFTTLWATLTPESKSTQILSLFKYTLTILVYEMISTLNPAPLVCIDVLVAVSFKNKRPSKLQGKEGYLQNHNDDAITL